MYSLFIQKYFLKEDKLSRVWDGSKKKKKEKTDRSYKKKTLQQFEIEQQEQLNNVAINKLQNFRSIFLITITKKLAALVKRHII